MSSLGEIHTYEETRQRWRDRYIEEMDEDTLELLKEQLFAELGKVNRLCNLLIMRPKGLGAGCIDAVEDVKSAMSRIKWHLDQRDKPVIRKNIDEIRALVTHHLDDPSPLGDAARHLHSELPLGSET